MKLVKDFLHVDYKKEFKSLIRSLDKRNISDINDSSSIYNGDVDFLYEIGICKKNENIETLLSRICGNVPPHNDSNMREFKRGVYLLVLDISVPNRYRDSQLTPLLYNNGELIELRIGDLLIFDQYKEHALFWDKRIDIATFWRAR